MSLFKGRYKYSLPERLTPAEARERRLTALLEKEQRFLSVPNFQPGIEAVRSRAGLERVNKSLAKAIVNDAEPPRQKAAYIAAALSRFTERDFANPQARAEYRKLRAAQEYLRSQVNLKRAAQQNASRGIGQKVSPSGGDKRHFNPTGKDFASTIYGTVARLAGWTQIPSFVSPRSVLPCIQRTVRREVMFAKKHAGKGYHTRKRRTWASGVPC